jgi:hypothetical protein
MPEKESLLAYVKKRENAFGKKLKCPNHSEGIKFEQFKKTVDTLAKPLSLAIDNYHAEKWK